MAILNIHDIDARETLSLHESLCYETRIILRGIFILRSKPGMTFRWESNSESGLVLNLSFDGVLKAPSFDGGGVESTPSPILFVKTIEK